MRFSVTLGLDVDDEADFLWCDDYEGSASLEEHFKGLIYDEDDIDLMSIEVERIKRDR